MLQLLWDASGLTKRYAAEIGTPTANALFNLSPRPTPVITYLGYVETYATLWRKRNRGILAPADFAASASAEGLSVLDPQLVSPADLPPFLAAL